MKINSKNSKDLYQSMTSISANHSNQFFKAPSRVLEFSAGSRQHTATACDAWGQIADSLFEQGLVSMPDVSVDGTPDCEGASLPTLANP